MIHKTFLTSLSRKSVLLILTGLFFSFNFLLNYFLPAENVLDLKFAYTVEQAYAAIRSLSKPDLEIYKYGIWTLDFPYMFIYGLLTSGLIFTLWKNVKVLIIPVSIMFFDLMENIFILKILETYKVINPYLAIPASIFTTCKWIMFGVLVFTILLGVIKKLNWKDSKIFSTLNLSMLKN